MIVSLSEKNPPEQKSSNFAKYSQPNIFRFVFFNLNFMNFLCFRYKLYTMGILYMYYVNKTNNALLTEVIKMTNIKNMKICYPFKG